MLNPRRYLGSTMLGSCFNAMSSRFQFCFKRGGKCDAQTSQKDVVVLNTTAE
jgi:hypothetical protein